MHKHLFFRDGELVIYKVRVFGNEWRDLLSPLFLLSPIFDIHLDQRQLFLRSCCLMIKSLYDFVIKKGPYSGLKILRKMYYDTALTSSPYALKALQEFVGPSKIVWGSDYPFASKLAPMVLKDLIKYEGFSEQDLHSVEYLNSLNLFPQLKNR